MKVSAINSFQKFSSITEEHRKPATEQPLPVHEFQPHQHKRVNPASVTGWVGAGAMGVAILAGVKKMPTLHKISAFIGAAAIAGHIGIISTFHHIHHPKASE